MGILPSPAAAQTCVPNSTAAPVPGTAVTCSGTTVDGDGANGFGDGTQDGLVITVTSGSSVTGTNLGFELNAGNVINNSGSISAAIGAGIFANDTLNVFNTGIIAGPFAGIASNGDLFVTNASSGVISGDTGIGGHNVTLVNHGTIGGVAGGIIATGFAGVANITNTGIISADPVFGLGVAGPQVHLSNSGTISGDTGVFAFGGGSTLVNSGWIIGTTSSIEFSGAGGDTLTLLPGSRLVGSVELGQFNAPSTINIQTGSDIGWLITFGACGCGGLVENQSVVNFFGGAPAVVAGNQIATLDPDRFRPRRSQPDGFHRLDFVAARWPLRRNGHQQHRRFVLRAGTESCRRE